MVGASSDVVRAEISNAAPVSVEPVATKADREAFIRLPWTIYADDPAWCPPLLYERRHHLRLVERASPQTMSAGLWLARQNGKVVGRISAQVNHAYLSVHDDATGHFGMIEAVDSPAVFATLFATAEDWLRTRGMERCVGPFNFTINEESGLLVDGFDTPPMIMMPHGRPYYAPSVEQSGYRSEKELLAYRLANLAGRPALKQRGVRLRGIDFSHFKRDVTYVLEIFNDAWGNNWGFVPMSADEIARTARLLRPLLSHYSASIAEIDGEPAAFALAIPNVNEAIRDLNGRLFPFGAIRLYRRLRWGTIKSARLALMGVRQLHQRTPLGVALGAAVLDAVLEAHATHGYREMECSWVLSDNVPARRGIERLGGDVYKTYRIYGKDL
ncbi:MAG: N-acetyltransferase [Proteobacteria bacterium]|nr:N-acetyltransferase [Pseudomonadota bacterium]